MSPGSKTWQPTASLARLRQRAALVERARRFFAARGLLEVETPLLVGAPVTDVNLHSARVMLAGRSEPLWLQTSPEYAMKRLLAGGSGDIWQLARVVRGAERSRLHNAEFSLLEWYRVGYSMPALIDEVAALCAELMGARRCESLRYADVFQQHTGLDPLDCADTQLRSQAATLALSDSTLASLSRDEMLDLCMALRIGPMLGRSSFTFVTHYPASQAALARLDPGDPRVALRFELYADGIELANGFVELADSALQRQRFEADNRERIRRGYPAQPLDGHLLEALQAGLPDCAGVALGFDRVVMIACGAQKIDEVIAFPMERA